MLGDAEDDVHVVLDEQDRDALLGVQAAHEVDHVIGLVIAHAGGRLVEQKEPRLQAECKRQFDDALIAMRKLADGAVLLAGEANDADQLLGAGDDIGARRTAEPGVSVDAGLRFRRRRGCSRRRSGPA